MQSIFRIVNTLKGGEPLKKERGLYTLQFVDYIDAGDSEEPLEIVSNSIDLTVGQILRDAMNMSEGLDKVSFVVTEDTTTDQVRYIEFIKEICRGISKDALQYCYSLYDDFYNLGRSKDAYVPTMNVKMELDCTDDGYLQEYFYIENYEDMLVYDFYTAVKGRFAVKKCQLCGTYFITQNRTDELYCSVACRNTVSRQRSKIHHRLDDENELLKRRIASRLQQRTKVSNLALRQEREQLHQQFLYDVKQWKKKIKRGAASAENYKLWLQAQDIRFATMIERREPLPAEARPTKVFKSSEVKLDENLAAKLEALASPNLEDDVTVTREAPKAPSITVDDDIEAFNAELAEYLPKEKPLELAPESFEDEISYEDQGVREDIKARFLDFGGKKRQNMQDVLFPDMDSYEGLSKQIEESGAENLDFGAFIKKTYGEEFAKREEKLESKKTTMESIPEDKIVTNLRPTNIRQSKFPLFESVLAAAEREEAEQGHLQESAKSEFEPYKALTIKDMKARLDEQKEALKAQGLDELAGLLEDNDE